jgi:hypothetical protein
MSYQSLSQLGDAGAVDAGGRHDIRLAKAIRRGDGLQHNVLARGKGAASVLSEHCIRPLAGSVQQMQ